MDHMSSDDQLHNSAGFHELKLLQWICINTGTFLNAQIKLSDNICALTICKNVFQLFSYHDCHNFKPITFVFHLFNST